MDPEKRFKRHEPEEPEQVSCDICLKEIPASVARTAEGSEYVHHFCGIECMEQWKSREPPEEEEGDEGGSPEGG